MRYVLFAITDKIRLLSVSSFNANIKIRIISYFVSGVSLWIRGKIRCYYAIDMVTVSFGQVRWMSESIKAVHHEYIRAIFQKEESLLQVYWKLAPQKRTLFSLYFNESYNDAIKILRLSKLVRRSQWLSIEKYNDIPIREGCNHWTISGVNHSPYMVELGIKQANNKFFAMLRTKLVQASEERLPIVEQLQTDSTTPAWTEFVSSYSYYQSGGRHI